MVDITDPDKSPVRAVDQAYGTEPSDSSIMMIT